MANSLGLPLLSTSDTIERAYERMQLTDTCAVVVAFANSCTLVESESLWNAWAAGKSTVGEAFSQNVPVIPRGGEPKRAWDVKLAVFSPDVTAGLALVLAEAEMVAKYALAPKVRFCKGPLKHSLPPTRLGANGKCGQCSNDVS